MKPVVIYYVHYKADKFKMLFLAIETWKIVVISLIAVQYVLAISVLAPITRKGLNMKSFLRWSFFVLFVPFIGAAVCYIKFRRVADAEDLQPQYVGQTLKNNVVPEKEPYTNFDITLAEEQDLQLLLSLQKLAYSTEAVLYPGNTLPPMEETLNEIKEDFKGGIILKAVSDGVVVGAVRGVLDIDTVNIRRLFVSPEYRKKGIGASLLRAIETKFPDKRYELFTGALSLGNLRLYHSLGYVEYKRKKAGGVELVYLEKLVPYKD